MKKIALLFQLILIPFVPLMAQIHAMVWNDEFDYSGLPDPQKWSYDIGGSGWGNNELQYYTENRTANARVENGKLIIEAIKESYGGMDYTSARLVSRQKGDWLYGRIEAYAKLPSGRGTWPAIWMLPTGWEYGSWPKSGEIDIMEYVGYDPGVVHGSIHTEAYNHTIGTQKTATINIPDAETAYHLYAVEWTAEKIDIYVDNTKYFTFTNEHTGYTTWPFDKAFHILLNIAVGGDWGGAQGVDPNIWPQKMYVDYVRVYQSITIDQVKIQGPDYSLENQDNLVFSVPNITNATYSWSVPEGATIVSGQGTSRIAVRWGTIQGNVTVQIIHPDAGGTYIHAVNMVVNPSGEKYSLVNFRENGITGWTELSNASNSITLTRQDSLLRVKYNITNPADYPYITYNFPAPVNMSEHTFLNIWMKTFNYSGSVAVRADLFDTEDRLADVSPVFRFTPVEPNGEFHGYSFNFDGNWGSNTPLYGQQLDKSMVKGIRFYINYGLYGKVASDSLWFQDIAVSPESLVSASIHKAGNPQVSIYPNPCSDYIRVKIPDRGNPLPTIFIYDIAGRLVAEKVEQGAEVTVSTQHFRAGIYLLKVVDGNSTEARLFLKI